MEKSILDLMESAAIEQEKIAITDIRQIKVLIERADLLEKEIEQTEELSKTLKEQLKLIVETQLPEAMIVLKISHFTHEGREIELKRDIYAKIPAQFEQQAFQWLKDNGHSDIIKSVVTVPFERGQEQVAENFIETVEANHLPYQFSKTIHAQTLKAFVTERIEKGEKIPLEFFGVYQHMIAKIKKAKIKL